MSSRHPRQYDSSDGRGNSTHPRMAPGQRHHLRDEERARTAGSPSRAEANLRRGESPDPSPPSFDRDPRFGQSPRGGRFFHDPSGHPQLFQRDFGWPDDPYADSHFFQVHQLTFFRS